MHINMKQSLCYTSETNAIVQSNYALIKKQKKKKIPWGKSQDTSELCPSAKLSH